MFSTEILDLFSESDCKKAAQLLLQGELVAIPTETVYGLAADAKNKEAVRKIFEVKKRPSNHPLIVHIATLFELEKWAVNIPEVAYKLAEAFWPGPLTMVLKKAENVSAEISGGLETIALRVPNQPKLLELMKKYELALVAPSANPHKKLSPTKSEHVYKSLYGKLPAVLDGGSCNVGLESTIVDLTQETPVILRKGPITKKELEDFLNIEIFDPKSHAIAAPGNMHIHYQPYTKSFLLDANEFNNHLCENIDKTVGFLYYSSYQKLTDHPCAIKLEASQGNYAAALYSSLHYLDTLQLKAIYIETPPNDPSWDAIKDRLIKATN